MARLTLHDELSPVRRVRIADVFGGGLVIHQHDAIAKRRAHVDLAGDSELSALSACLRVPEVRLDNPLDRDRVDSASAQRVW